MVESGAPAEAQVTTDRVLQRLERQLHRIQARLAEARRQISERDARMRSLVKRQRHCTGFAFVTFNDEAATLRRPG